MSRPMLFSLMTLGLACAGAPALDTIEPVGPVRLDRLEVPTSLEVLWVGQEMFQFNSGARSFLNVYGEHKRSGQPYLLVYQRTRGGSRLVNIVAISGTLSDSLLPPIDSVGRSDF